MMQTEKIDEAAQEVAEEDRKLFQEIGEGMDKIGLFASRTFKAKRFVKERDGPVEKLALFAKYYAVFLNSFKAQSSEIQKRFVKVFNELMPDLKLGKLLARGDEYDLRQCLKNLTDKQVALFVDKLVEEEVIDYEH